MLPGLALGASAALVTGVGQVLMAATSRRIGTMVTTALVLSASLVWFLPLLLVAQFPASGAWWLQVFVMGCVNAAAFVLAVEALRLGPLSVVGPIAATGSVVTVVLAALLLDERLPQIAVVAVPIVGAGAILCSVTTEDVERGERGRPHVVSGGAIAMALAVVLIALFTIGLQQPVREAGWSASVIVARAVSVAVSVTLLAPGVRRERHGWHRASAPERDGRANRLATVLPLVLLIGFVLSVAQVFLAASLQTAPAWVVGATTSLGPAVIAVAGVVIYGEHLSRRQLAGIIAIAVGIVLLTFEIALGP